MRTHSRAREIPTLLTSRGQSSADQVRPPLASRVPGHAVFRAWCRHFVFCRVRFQSRPGGEGAAAWGNASRTRSPLDGDHRACIRAMAGGTIDIRARFSTRSTPSSRASASTIAVGAAHRTPSRRSPREWDGGGARARARPGARRPVRSRASARDADGPMRVHPRRHRRIPPPPTGPRRPSRAAPHPIDDLSDAPELDTTDPHYSLTSNRFSAKANAARPPPSLPHRTQWHPSHTRRRLTRPRRRPAHPPAPRGGAHPRRTTQAAIPLHPTIHPRPPLRRR